MMKFKELAQLGKEEREQKMKELQLELIKLNSQVATGTPPKNAGHLKRIKKDLARIMLLKSQEEAISLLRKTPRIPRQSEASIAFKEKELPQERKVSGTKKGSCNDW